MQNKATHIKMFPNGDKNVADFSAPSIKKGADKILKTRHNMDMKPLSIKQAYTYLGISRASFYRLLDTKAIRNFHIGHRRFVTMAAICDYITDNETGGEDDR